MLVQKVDTTGRKGEQRPFDKCKGRSPSGRSTRGLGRKTSNDEIDKTGGRGHSRRRERNVIRVDVSPIKEVEVLCVCVFGELE